MFLIPVVLLSYWLFSPGEEQLIASSSAGFVKNEHIQLHASEEEEDSTTVIIVLRMMQSFMRYNQIVFAPLFMIVVLRIVVLIKSWCCCVVWPLSLILLKGRWVTGVQYICTTICTALYLSVFSALLVFKQPLYWGVILVIILSC